LNKIDKQYIESSPYLLTYDQQKAVDAYSEWLALPYQVHLTIRLPYNDSSSLKLNQWLAHTVLSPLQQYLQTKLAAVISIVTNGSRHAHCLLVAPETTISVDAVQHYLTNSINRSCSHHDRVIQNNLPGLATQAFIESTGYVFKHLVKQDATLHFYNKHLLNIKEFTHASQE
jgi:hypothetical protein